MTRRTFWRIIAGWMLVMILTIITAIGGLQWAKTW